MKEKIRDCSSCAKKPPAGDRYEETSCCRCQPYEPSNNRNGMGVQKPAWWWKQYSNGEVKPQQD